MYVFATEALFAAAAAAFTEFVAFVELIAALMAAMVAAPEAFTAASWVAPAKLMAVTCDKPVFVTSVTDSAVTTGVNASSKGTMSMAD